jgi:hypothetical protein
MNSSQEEINDNPVKWVADHIRRYIKSDGKNGHGGARQASFNTHCLDLRHGCRSLHRG